MLKTNDLVEEKQQSIILYPTELTCLLIIKIKTKHWIQRCTQTFDWYSSSSSTQKSQRKQNQTLDMAITILRVKRFWKDVEWTVEESPQEKSEDPGEHWEVLYEWVVMGFVIRILIQHYRRILIAGDVDKALNAWVQTIVTRQVVVQIHSHEGYVLICKWIRSSSLMSSLCS